MDTLGKLNTIDHYPVSQEGESESMNDMDTSDEKEVLCEDVEDAEILQLLSDLERTIQMDAVSFGDKRRPSPKARTEGKLEVRESVSGSKIDRDLGSGTYVDAVKEATYPGLIIILNLLCSCSAALRGPEMKITLLSVILKLLKFLGDDIKLERIVPYAVMMLQDPSAKVRAFAISVLTQTLESVNALPASETNIFPYYIFQLCCALRRIPTKLQNWHL